MKKIKKIKKIKKEVELKPIEVVEPKAEPVEESHLPDNLKATSFAAKILEYEQFKAKRDKELSEYICPDGWQILCRISHRNTHEDAVTKEFIFWSKYKPDHEVDTVHISDYAAVIIGRKKIKK